MRKTPLIAAAALVAGLLTVSATITPYSWQRFTTLKSPGLDATGNNHPISGGYTGNGESPGGSQPIVTNISVGGPLGPEGYFSGYSIRCKANQNNQGCFFEETSSPYLTNTSPWGNFFQTNSNWVVESWILPTKNGCNSQGLIFGTGVNRLGRYRPTGIILTALNGRDLGESNTNGMNNGHVFLRCQAICPTGMVDSNGVTMSFYIGPEVLIKTPTNAAWMHVAVVRDDTAVAPWDGTIGTISWYTNGVLVAATNAYRVFTTNAYSCPAFGGGQDIGLGDNFPTAPDPVNHNAINGGALPFDGYMAELRWSYFKAGEFSVTNLLTRRASPAVPKSGSARPSCRIRRT